jgi:hypothetical protein
MFGYPAAAVLKVLAVLIAPGSGIPVLFVRE